MIYLNPIKVKTQNKRIRIQTAVDRPFSKRGNKSTKIVDPNFDVLPVAFDLFGLYLDTQEVGAQVVQVNKNTLGSKASLLGILRALLLLKIMNPALYGMIVEAAKLLSYEVDESFEVPPLTFLLEGENPVVEKVWISILNKTGITKEEYAREVSEEFTKKGLFEVIALFSKKQEEDKRALSRLMQRPITSSAVPYGLRTYSNLSEDLELILEELRKGISRE